MNNSVSANQKGFIFNIQRYCIHDGPGIRTTVFLKGCPLTCFWCQNPESQKPHPEILLKKDICTTCGRCVEVCPAQANVLTKTSSTIDRDKCIGCGTCVSVCPTQARSISGEKTSVGDIMEEVLRDRSFYKNSGGGITLSGGEPTAQPDFTLQILKASKEHNLHTAVETCGYAPWRIIERILDYTDLVLYDLKCLDLKKHQMATGKSNALILENARKIFKLKHIIFRTPLIPGFNDTSAHIRDIAKFIRYYIGGSQLELLPYNKLGHGKYDLLDRPECNFSNVEQSQEHLQMLNDILKTELQPL